MLSSKTENICYGYEVKSILLKILRQEHYHFTHNGTIQLCISFGRGCGAKKLNKMTDLQFTFEAIENNPDSAKIICEFYGKSNAELANALKQRVLRHKGKNAKLVIDFTDVNTNQTIKYTKS